MTKIPVVILFYKNWHFLLQMLERLKDPRLEINIIHNLSEDTRPCVDILNQWVKCGLISKQILFHENISNNAVMVTLKDGLINFDNSEYFILTDGDLLPDRGWLDEQLDILNNNKNVFVVCNDLYTDNLPTYGLHWIPPSEDRGDYLEGNAGGHLMLFRTEEFKQYVDFMFSNGLMMCDTNIHNFAKHKHMKSAKTKQTKSKHLTWDLYNDLNHPYTKERKENPNIWTTNKTSTYEVFS